MIPPDWKQLQQYVQRDRLLVLFQNHRLPILFGAIAIVSLSAALIFYARLASVQESANSAGEQETSELLAMVGQLIALPENEIPTIATVTNPDILRNQPFFARAVKGDKVLIYTNSKKAILYDPVNHKLREVGPLDITSTP